MVGTALAVAAGASALGGLFKAKKQSDSAKQAAQYQVDATNRATNYMQQGMGQLGQLWAPYVNSGAGAMGTIGRLTTPGPGARFASPGPPNTIPMMPPNGMPPNQAVPRGYPPSPYGGGPQGPPPPPYGGPPMYGGTFAQFGPQGRMMSRAQY